MSLLWIGIWWDGVEEGPGSSRTAGRICLKENRRSVFSLLLHPEEPTTKWECQLPRYAICHSKDVLSTERLHRHLDEITTRFSDNNERQRNGSNPEISLPVPGQSKHGLKPQYDTKYQRSLYLTTTDSQST